MTCCLALARGAAQALALARGAAQAMSPEGMYSRGAAQPASIPLGVRGAAQPANPDPGSCGAPQPAKARLLHVKVGSFEFGFRRR